MASSTRAEAIATLEEGHGALQALFRQLSEDELTRPATIGGGDWSAKDLMGHLAFWEEFAVEAAAHARAGRRPPVAAVFDRGVEGIDEANAGNQRRTAGESLEEVRGRAAAAHREVLDLIRTLPDDEWAAEPPYPNPHKPTMAEVLGSILGGVGRDFAHAWAHIPDLEAYVSSVRGVS